MKKIGYILSLFTLILMLLTSCKKDEGVKGDFNASFKAWKKFKSSVNNSYQYTVVSGSWTGFGNETTIDVKNGKVIQRTYTATTMDGATGVKKIVEQWTEDLTTLNVHNNGAAALTLDEIYMKAETEWLVNIKNADTYLETKNQGMISMAGYVPKGCMDDCFTGITISSIRSITTEI